MLTHPKHQMSPPVFMGVHIASALVFILAGCKFSLIIAFEEKS
jgi:hypothetical protein